MKLTRFNAHHRKRGAKRVEFCGWDVPVEYKGLIEEPLACRPAAVVPTAFTKRNY
jgi:glycine cleavage system aminomethyltransferase T